MPDAQPGSDTKVHEAAASPASAAGLQGQLNAMRDLKMRFNKKIWVSKDYAMLSCSTTHPPVVKGTRPGAGPS
jgi:hypothetical protein